MQAKLLILAALILGSCQLAVGQNLLWATRTGGSDDDRGQAMCTDAEGNVYVTGNFNGTVDFDPGPLATNLTAVGQFDVFVSKTDATGNLIWAVSFGSANSDGGSAIATDTAGNVYVAGNYTGNADFDPGAGVFMLSHINNDDVFVQKLTSAGDFVWAARIAGNHTDLASGIVADAMGDIFIAGSFRNTVDFDPGAGTHNITAVSVYDAFLLKLSTNGGFLWATSYGSAGFNNGLAVALDSAGNVYTSGKFTFTVDFDPGPATFNMTAPASSDDAYITKLNSAGDFIWARSITGGGNQTGNSLAIAPGGEVYVSGYYQGATTLDTGSGPVTFPLGGSVDSYVLKLSPNGDLLWVRQITSAQAEYFIALATDAAGHVYCGGYFNGTVDFDPGSGTHSLTSAGGADACILRLDADGNFVAAMRLGGIDNDVFQGLSTDAAGNLYGTGDFREEATIEPGTLSLTSAGQQDIFLLKFDNLVNGVADMFAAPAALTAYPNPFSTSTSLRFPATADATLLLYNALGQQVRTFPAAHLRQLTLQRQNLTAGIYLLKLVQDNRVVAAGRLVLSD